MGYFNKAKENALMNRLMNVIGMPNYYFICSLIMLYHICLDYKYQSCQIKFLLQVECRYLIGCRHGLLHSLLKISHLYFFNSCLTSLLYALYHNIDFCNNFGRFRLYFGFNNLFKFQVNSKYTSILTCALYLTQIYSLLFR